MIEKEPNHTVRNAALAAGILSAAGLVGLVAWKSSGKRADEDTIFGDLLPDDTELYPVQEQSPNEALTPETVQNILRAGQEMQLPPDNQRRRTFGSTRKSKKP